MGHGHTFRVITLAVDSPNKIYSLSWGVDFQIAKNFSEGLWNAPAMEFIYPCNAPHCHRTNAKGKIKASRGQWPSFVLAAYSASVSLIFHSAQKGANAELSTRKRKRVHAPQRRKTRVEKSLCIAEDNHQFLLGRKEGTADCWKTSFNSTHFC